MKKTILLPYLIISIFVSAQPKLVGTLQYNGQKEGGSVFRVDIPGPGPGVIHYFDNLSPHAPTSGVAAGNDNWLYGMLNFNGVNDTGGLYKITRDGTDFQMLYNLDNRLGNIVTPYYHSDGLIYFSNEFQIKKLDPLTNIVTGFDLQGGIATRNLLIDTANWIYFVTEGSSLVKVKTDSTQWTDLHPFNSFTEGTNGIAGVTEIPGDSLFGTLVFGGTFDGGAIYSIKKNGSSITIHHSFISATGKYPESRLVYFDGKLYGTTSQGGSFDNGVLFSINSDGTGYRVLHDFEPGSTAGTAPPGGDIFISSNGRIFGAFSQFYSLNYTYYRMFKVDTSGENFEIFSGVDQREQGGGVRNILLSNDDSIFFATSEFGRHDGGALSKSDTMGYAVPIHQFGYSANGFRPQDIIKAADGKLYGTTQIGGVDGNGVIYSMNANGGGYTRLHEFIDSEGYMPSGKLLEGSDGKLYGTLKYGGLVGTGGIYRIDKDGNNFNMIFHQTIFADGYTLNGSLVEVGGTLYGTNSYSSPGAGTLFRINMNGSNYTVLKHFDSSTVLNYPFSGVIYSNGYLYGTTAFDIPNNQGGVYRIRTDSSGYQVLHQFFGPNDGSYSSSIPIIATNGKLYGTTVNGGLNNNGIVFRIDTTGSNYLILRNLLESTDGAYPYAGVIQASDGLIYGGTYTGINGGSGGNIIKMNLDGSNFSIVRSFNYPAEGYGLISLLDLNGPVVLPVQLLTFTAQKAGQNVLLNWKTVEEQNSDRFEIERSADGNRFITIGSLTAAGNTRAVKNYIFTDLNPLKGLNFYRLKLVDKDETFSFSKVVSVNFDKLEKLYIFPNPASDHLEIHLPEGNSYSSINLIDASGKLVLQKNISISSAIIRVDIHHLSAGWYVLKLNGKEIQQLSFIKR